MNRAIFLSACEENARATAKGKATENQLKQTCSCLLAKVEAHYSFDEFARFERDLQAGTAKGEDSANLLNWSTQCAREAAGK